MTYPFDKAPYWFVQGRVYPAETSKETRRAMVKKAKATAKATLAAEEIKKVCTHAIPDLEYCYYANTDTYGVIKSAIHYLRCTACNEYVLKGES